MIKRLFKNTYFVTLFVKFASLGMTILSGAMLARFMGPSLKGQLASLESIAQIISVFLNFGVYHLYPKMVKDHLENVRQRFVDIFYAQFILYSVIVSTIFIVTSNVNVLYYGFVSIVACLVSQLTMMCMVEYPIYRSVCLLLVSVANLVVTIVIFVIDVTHILLVPVLVYLFKDLLFCVLIMIKLRIIPHVLRVDLQLVVKLMKFGFVPMVTALLLKLNYKVDIIMLNLFSVSDEKIGIYSVGISIATQLWIIPEAFKEVLYSKSTHKDSEGSFVYALKFSTYTLFIIDIIIITLGYWIILLLYGASFIGASPLLSILVIGVPFMGVFNIVNPYYLAMGQYTIHLKNLSLGVISNIIVNSFLIIPLGSVGAAIATSVSQIICGVYAYIQFSKSSGIPLKKIAFINREDLKLLKKVVIKK